MVNVLEVTYSLSVPKFLIYKIITSFLYKIICRIKLCNVYKEDRVLHLWDTTHAYTLTVITFLSLSSPLFPLESETNKEFTIIISIRHCITGPD